jgi:MFS family permease
MTQKTKPKMVLAGCCLMLTIAYMSLAAWGIAVPALAETFKLSETMIQLGNAALIGGYAVGSFVEGRMFVSFGFKKTSFFAIGLFIIASILIPYIKNYPIILCLRFAMGFGLIVNITTTIVSSWFPIKQRGLAVGILLGCIGLGSAFGGIVTGVLSSMLGWQEIFLSLAAITIVGFILFQLTVKEPPVQVDETPNQPAEETPDTGISIYRQPVLWLFALMLLFVFFNVYGLYAYLAIYMQTEGYTVMQAGLLVFFNGFIAVASTPVGGLISDRLVKKVNNVLKARVYTIAFAAAAVGFLGCILIPVLAPLGFGGAILVSLISGWGCPAANSPILLLPTDLLGKRAAGTGIGIIILIAGIGGIVSPILVPFIAESAGWTTGWFITAAAALGCMIISLLIPKVKVRTKH